MVGQPIAEDEIVEVKRNPWADNFFRPLLLTVMMMCFNISLVNLARLVNPAWNGAYFLAGMLLTTVEAIYSYRVLRFYRSRGTSLLRYRLAEAAILILILKLINFAGKSLDQIGAEMQDLWQDPGSFITYEFYVILILAAVAWLSATQTMEDFEALHDPYSFRTDNIIMPLDELTSRFFWGGALLVLISGLTQWVVRAGWASLADWQRPSLGGVILNVMIYFTLGLVLLSQAHLTTLLLRWRIQKINVTPHLVKQWAKYGLVFLGLVMFAAFVLPTGYTLGFLTSAGVLIQYLLEMLVFLVRVLIFLLTLPLIWLLSLLDQTPEKQFLGSGELPVLPQVPPAAPLPWLEALRSLIFWLIAAAIATYFIKAYLADHPELLQALRGFKPIGFMLDFLISLWQKVKGLAQAGLELLPKRASSSGQAGNQASLSQRRRWAGLGSLSPREQILYYYLNILERVARHGPARQKHQTPYEYEPELSQTIPEAQPPVNLLTQAFVHARYSQEVFEERQAKLAKILWQQIRRELGRLSVDDKK